MKASPLFALAGLVLAQFLCGCHSIGPATVARDRFDYSSAITESWKRQTLLNVVKMRYVDPPIFVDVGQIVSGYSLETGVTVGGGLESVNGNNGVAIGGSGTFTDRPTITYTPLTGNKFLKSLMMPIPPPALFMTIQSGWAADTIMLIGVSSLNGLKNEESSANALMAADDGFIRALELMRKIQRSGAVGIRVAPTTNKSDALLIAFHDKGVSAEIQTNIMELRGLLHLAPDAQEFHLVFAATPTDGHELAVLTRSVLQIMNTMASEVEVPPQDIAEGRTTPGQQGLGDKDQKRLIRIHSGDDRPKDAFVAVPYRGHWFWIDDRDLRSKRMLSFLMIMFTLADDSDHGSAPLLTIPAQ